MPLLYSCRTDKIIYYEKKIATRGVENRNISLQQKGLLWIVAVLAQVSGYHAVHSSTSSIRQKWFITASHPEVDTLYILFNPPSRNCLKIFVHRNVCLLTYWVHMAVRVYSATKSVQLDALKLSKRRETINSALHRLYKRFAHRK